MRALALFAFGLFLGPLSWVAAYAFSGRFEPFDDITGLLVCQTVLTLALSAVGLREGVVRALFCLVGAWVGMLGYAYLAGGSEMRAWIVLLMFSSLTLLALPLAAALAGGAIRAVLRKSRDRAERAPD